MTTDTPPALATDRHPQFVVVVAADDDGVAAAMLYANRLVGGVAGQIITVVPGTEPRDEIPPEPDDWSAVLAAEPGNAAIRVSENVRDAIDDACENLDRPLVILAASKNWPPPVQLQRLVASPRWPLLVLFSSRPEHAPRRILVATNTIAPLSREERIMSYELVAGEETQRVDFLRLVEEGSNVDTDELQRVLRERIEKNAPAFDFDVIVREARSFEAGILGVLDENGEYDMVLLDAPRQGLISRLSERVIPRRLVTGSVPVLLYAAPAGRISNACAGAWNAVYRLVPNPSETERVATYTQLRRNSRGSADFHVLLGLSVIIASFGLLLDSPAVVIGAMIVAPLMQPVLGVGLGVATVNGKLTRIAAVTVVRGVLMAVIIALIIGYLVPTAVVTGELNARGEPTLLDLLIALASGAAGAYAMGRKGAASSAAGVAIAVALVPPLATAGIGLALGEESLAIGAALLFITNVSAIGAMSALMFMWMGFKPATWRFGTRSRLVQGLATMALMVLVVAFFIVARSKSSDARFQREVFVITEVAVQGVEPEAELLSVVLESNGDVLIVFAGVDADSYSGVIQQLPLIQSDVTRQLGRPAVLQFYAVGGQ